jgi:hypothetical protein
MGLRFYLHHFLARSFCPTQIAAVILGGGHPTQKGGAIAVFREGQANMAFYTSTFKSNTANTVRG